MSVDAQSNIHRYSGFTFENDSFVQQDGLYSSGLMVYFGKSNIDSFITLSSSPSSFASTDQVIPSGVQRLLNQTYFASVSHKKYAYSHQIAQLLQTSVDLKSMTLVEQDAPYVGLLAWQGTLSHYGESQSDQLAMTFGIAGPASGGEAMQKWVHQTIQATAPQGWNNQINNEFVFDFQAQRTWQGAYINNQYTEFDFIYGGKAALGNLRSDLEAGILMRIGSRLKDNLFSAPVFPVRKLNHSNKSAIGWYFFINASAAYVFNDIFIDGNTFSRSHSVDLINQQLAVSSGVNISYKNISVLYSLVRISDQYQGQREPSTFGSLDFTYHF